MNTTPSTCGANADAFREHPGYRRMFAPDTLTLGIFMPLRFYDGDMRVLSGQARLVSKIDQLGFAAVWVRDVPLFDPHFGDAGQVFDPFAYLAYLAAHTEHIALVTGSTVFPLRHPIDLAKAAATLDNLSGGRLVLGIASGTGPWSSRPTAWTTITVASALPRAWTTSVGCWPSNLGRSTHRWGNCTAPACCPRLSAGASRW